ncbi:MAG: GNAT family N-acetyltransferase [Bacteroidia bacterium]|nr:GNAT family N-acetyltransferase [Bacteroidia bacterium]
MHPDRKRLIDLIQPRELPPARLDRLLAGGWFRGGPALFRPRVLCMEGGLFSILNIRLPLDGYSPSGSLQRILRRHAGFRTEIGPVQPDADTERLYQAQKARFRGFIFPTLEDFLFAGISRSLFQTREVRVYDGDRLIAASYFDIGARAAASLLGLFDAEYSRLSPGLYTMLCEIRYGIGQGLRWYYPGYVLDGDPSFNYKLRLGDMQYYTFEGRWQRMSRLDPDRLAGNVIHAAIARAELLLSGSPIRPQRHYNVFFSLGYLVNQQDSFLESPLLLICRWHSEDRLIGIDYLFEQGCYRIVEVYVSPDYPDIMLAEYSDAYFAQETELSGIPILEAVLDQDPDAERIVQRLRAFMR